MKGYPKYLNTKEDYEYVKAHFPKEQWQPDYKALLDERMAWLNVGKLTNEKEGVTDNTHKIVTVGGEDAGTPVQYYQYEHKEDKNCKLFRLGLTVEKAQDLLY